MALVLAGMFTIAFTSMAQTLSVDWSLVLSAAVVADIAIALLAIEHAIIGRPSATGRGGRA